MLFALIAAAHPASAQLPRRAWKNFLEAPTAESYARVADAIRGCRDERCASEVAPDSAEVLRLAKLAKNGVRLAIRLALQSRKFLGGGGLEDLFAGLGGAADSCPKILLEEIELQRLTVPEVEAIVEMLPSEVVDDLALRRAAIERRMRSLSKVDEAALRVVRDQAVAALRLSLDALPKRSP
jgi:hypothetical protein